ncbi:hypothetical protein [Gluconobacter wancherniae]|uniref:hypothetical protein n=1 Tax=Gluconobacter wancherniae TaxID=1307955 RepID=UPI001B8D1A14|nr:hypothetical protein [Gluconobacter wancherniae]MBS1087636.1 hypothetical protein [Gluconobacter wancherniae]
MSVSLDPNTLPIINVVGLAQSGTILRAERKTPSDGVPAFVTRDGWEELVSLYAKDSEKPHEIVLPALERAAGRILAHAAEAAVSDRRNSPVFNLESDLFASDPTLVLAFVRDTEHPVACALIGTAAQLSQILRQGDQLPPL